MHLKKVLTIFNSSRTSFFICLITFCLISSCNFNITDNPGPQISSTIESSKKHGTFICAYKITGNKLNGFEVTSIFAEKSYLLTEGLFGHFDIDCCKSQLVIVLKNDVIPTLNNEPINWKIIDFEIPHSSMAVKYYKSAVFPDKLDIQVIPSIKDTSNIENITLLKQ